MNDPTFFLLYCILQLDEKVLHDDDDHGGHGDHGDHGVHGDHDCHVDDDHCFRQHV